MTVHNSMEEMLNKLTGIGVNIPPEMAEFQRSEAGIEATKAYELAFNNWKKAKNDIASGTEVNALKNDIAELKQMLMNNQNNNNQNGGN